MTLSHSKTPWSLSVIVAVMAAWAVFFPHGAEARRSRWKVYSNADFDFRMLAPKGWYVSEQKTHPSIMVAFRIPEGAELRVSVKVGEQRITLKAFAKSEVKVLEKLGFSVGELEQRTLSGREALFVSGSKKKGSWRFQLYFLQRDRVGYALSVVYRSGIWSKVERDVKLALQSFKLTSK
jgi:hypothetical protein